MASFAKWTRGWPPSGLYFLPGKKALAAQVDPLERTSDVETEMVCTPFLIGRCMQELTSLGTSIRFLRFLAWLTCGDDFTFRTEIVGKTQQSKLSVWWRLKPRSSPNSVKREDSNYIFSGRLMNLLMIMRQCLKPFKSRKGPVTSI